MTSDLGILWFVLDKQSSDRLRQIVPPRYANPYYHHATLQYGVNRQDVSSLVGKSWTVTVYAVAYNKDTQAARMDSHGLPDMYGVPHITLSTAVGVKPFASVAMLQDEHEEDLCDEPFDLTGTIEFEYIKNIKD